MERPQDEIFFAEKAGVGAAFLLLPCPGCQDRLLGEGFESSAALRWLAAWGDGPRLLALVLEAPSPLRLPGIVPEVPLHISICFEASQPPPEPP